MAANHLVGRLLIAGALLIPIALACVEESPALFIMQNSGLDDSCAPAEDVPLGRGTMDITVANTYTMFPSVKNLMTASGSASLGGGAGGTYEGNRVTLSSALVSIVAPANLDTALPRNVSIPISGTLEPGAGQVVELDVLDAVRGDQLRQSLTLQARGSVVPLTVTISFFGTTTSGTDVESNEFTFPLQVCRGCLLDFPVEASDPADEQPNCLALPDLESDDEAIDAGCLPGQDKALDCRACRVLVAAQGQDDSEVDAACEPRSEP